MSQFTHTPDGKVWRATESGDYEVVTDLETIERYYGLRNSRTERLSSGEKLRMGLHGLSAGFSDEALGMLASGRTSGPEYIAARDAERMRLEELQSRDPLASTAYGAAGGATGMLPGPAIVGRVAPKLPGWIQAMIGGGSMGAVAGMGEAERPGEIAKPVDYVAPVGVNTVLGAGTAGIAYPVLASTGGAATGAAARFAGRYMDPNQVAYRSLARRLESEGRTPAEIEAMLGQGDRNTLVDVSPNVRADVESTVTTTPAARETVEATLGRRSEETGNFLRDRLRADFGFSKNRIETRKDIEQRQEQELGPEYELARTTPIGDIEALKNLLRAPIVQKLWQQVSSTARNTGIVRGEMVPNAGAESFPTFEGWKQIGTALNGAINKATRAGDTGAAGRLREVRNAINAELDSNLPGYESLRSKWSDSERAKELLEQGRRFFSMEEDEFKEYVDSLTAGELQYFRLAATDAIRTKFHSGARRGRAGESAMRTLGAEAKLRALYADPDRADSMAELLRTLELQQSAYEQLTRGSATARRLAQNEDFGENVIGAVADYALGNPSQGSLRSAMQWMSGFMTRLRVPEKIKQRILQTAISGDQRDFLRAWEAIRASTPRKVWQTATGGVDLPGVSAMMVSGADTGRRQQ